MGDLNLQSEHIIKLEKLSKWFGSFIALNDITLDIPRGVIGVLGPNGAGKTTLLKIILGHMKQSSGKISVLGMNPWNNAEMNLLVGFTTDSDSLYDFLTGMEFIKITLMMKGFSPRKAKTLAENAIEKVKLEREAYRKIGSYSHGMRQKIKFAFAIAHNPALLVLDEPFVGIDPVVKNTLLELVKDMAKEGKNIIISSHILPEIAEVTQNIILIYKGRLLAYGNIHEIRNLIDTHPHSVYISSKAYRTIANYLVNDPDLISLKFMTQEDAIIVETAQPDRFYTNIVDFAVKNGIIIDKLISPDDNLEKVYEYLIKD